jgi:hypothetical protein
MKLDESGRPIEEDEEGLDEFGANVLIVENSPDFVARPKLEPSTAATPAVEPADKAEKADKAEGKAKPAKKKK